MIRRRLGWFLGSMLAACGGSEDGREPPEGAIGFVLDPSADAAPVGNLFGWNLGRGTLYARPNDPIHPEWRQPERAAGARALAEISGRRAERPLARFSGLQIDGALGGDGYHFWDFVRPDRSIAPTDNMASFQYMALIRECGADPGILLNFGSGTAEEAARYVRHLRGTNPDDPMVAARAHWDRPEPYPSGIFEIGNEVYGFWNTGFNAAGEHSYANPEAVGGGDPGWHGRPSSDPADYAARAMEYLEAVLAVAPDARIWIPLAQASMEAWGGLEAALIDLEPLLVHPSVEAVVIHHYQVDDGTRVGLADRNDPQSVLGGIERFVPLYRDLRRRLADLDRAVPMKIAVTEFHVAGAFSRGIFTLGETPMLGLGIADMLLAYANLDIEFANQHLALNFDAPDDPGRDPLLESWYNPFRADGTGGVIRMPNWQTTRLLADNILDHRLEAMPTEMPTVLLTLGGEGVPPTPIPAAQALASRSRDGRRMALAILHRDLERTQTLTVDTPSGWRVEAVERYAPIDPLADAATQPTAIEPAVWESGAHRVAVTLPPHSLTTLRWTRP